MHGSPAKVTAPSMPQIDSEWSERVWIAAVGALLLNSLLRGIRPPGMWAYTQFLLNYDYGFAKRALQGAVIDAINIPGLHTYNFAFCYMMAVLTINVLLLLWLMRRLIATEDMTARLSALLFASSLAVVALAHFVGYGDQPALMITLLALAIRNFYRRCILVAILFPVCLLIQETEFVIFFPLIAFRFLIDFADDATVQRTKLAALFLVFACVLTTLTTLANTHMSEASATAMLQSIQSEANYPLRLDQTKPLSTSFTDFLRMTADAYSYPSMLRFAFLSFIVTLPSTAYLMRQTWSLMAGNGCPMFLRTMAMAASVAPLSLIVIAADVNRFAAFSVLTSFIAYATIKLRGVSADAVAPPSKMDLLLPAGLIAMNLSSSIPLFDGYVVRSFPYEELLHDLNDALIFREPFPPSPEQCTVTPPYYCVFINPMLRPPESGISESPPPPAN
jgi:hypothetical protein